MTTAKTYEIALDPADHPGIKRVDNYVPGTVYAVSAADAVRLVDVHAFHFVHKADEASARAAAKAAAAAAAEAAAPAATESTAEPAAAPTHAHATRAKK